MTAIDVHTPLEEARVAAPARRRPPQHGKAALVALISTVAALLYLPLGPLLIASFSDDAGGFTFRWYQEIGRAPLIMASLRTSLIVALLVGVLTPVLAVLAATAVRELPARRLLITLFLTPLFVPGVSMGLSSALFQRLIGIEPSLATIVLAHVLWAFPFAFLIVLAVMTTFDPRFLEAAYTLGAGRWRAFVDIELPALRPGVAGAAIFSVILSFNETVRTTMVQGPYNTVQTYIWSAYLQVGLSPTLYALMGGLVLITLALVVVLVAGALGRKGDAAQ